MSDKHAHTGPLRGARHGVGRYTEPLATRAGFTEEKRKVSIYRVQGPCVPQGEVHTG